MRRADVSLYDVTAGGTFKPPVPCMVHGIYGDPDNGPLAVVELTDGTVHYAAPDKVKFHPEGEEPAELAYEAYRRAVDFFSVSGDPLPAWTDLPLKIKTAWTAAALIVVSWERGRAK